MTKIASAPGNGVLPIDLPGSPETNGITIEVILGGSLLFRGEAYSFDEIYNTGIYMNMNNAPDYPGSNPYGMLIVFAAPGMSVQLYMSTTSSLYIRQYSSGQWSVWKSASFT